MIDTTIPLIGHQIMAMAFGAMTAKAVQAKNAMMIQQQAQALQSIQNEVNTWEDISFDMTSKIIDKRFKVNQEYIQSGGAVFGDLRPRRTASAEELRFAYVARQSMMKAQTRYNNAVSQQNKRLADMKAKASFHLADLKKIM